MSELFRLALKWDPYHKRYSRPYVLPEDVLKCSLAESDMNKVIACAGCGESVKYGSAYTSLEIHTETGIGFSVCENCHAGEIERAKDAEEMQREEER